MKKAPEAFRTISEVAEILETPAHVLRFWESKFYQIRPVKRAGGRRYYRPDDVALINGIRILLQDRGLTIRGVQRILQEKGPRHVTDLGGDLPAIIDQGTVIEAQAGAGPEATEPAQIEAEAPPAATQPAPEAVVLPFTPPAPPESEPARVLIRQRAPAPAAPEAAAEPEATEAEPVPPRLSQILRQAPREGLGPRRDRVIGLARRLDALLDRMSEASGAGRW